MASISEIIKRIEEQKIGNRPKQVLLVEGSDDVQAVSAFLDKGKPDWENNWIVAEAQSKKNVLAILQKKTGWLGIVDRDEWTAEIISDRLQEHPNLWVLPRFCIENYMIVPDELWEAFPSKQREKVADGLSGLENGIITDLDKWVAHGVLWKLVNPLWEGLRSLGFKEKLLDPEIALDERKIRETFEEWHDFLEPDQLWKDFQARLDEVSMLDIREKLKHWVHGKMFYKKVINPLLDKLLGLKSAQNRKKSIFRTLPVPNEFTELFDKMKSWE